MALPVGPEVSGGPAIRPERAIISGRHVTLTPLDSTLHTDSLWAEIGGPHNDDLWAYLFEGPFADHAAFEKYMQQKSISEDPLYFAIQDNARQSTVGHASYLRMNPVHRSIEVGALLFAPILQRTVGATEAMYLMARHAFEDLGYRRYEWKCNALNEPSRRAALRLGFTFEGVFRQHMIVKGRSRDTAWFSMLDSEWPPRKAAFERWLHPDNFDESGTQKHPLMSLRS